MAKMFTYILAVILSLLSLRLRVILAEPPQTCVLTGLPPHVPSVTASRCPEASQLSCCDDCADIDHIAKAMSMNGVDILNLIGPMGGIFGGNTFRLCNFIAKQQKCQYNWEALTCATYCNPDSYKYMYKNTSNVIFRICQSFADELYDDCKGSEFPGVGPVSLFIQDSATFMYYIICDSMMVMLVQGFTVTIVPNKEGSCYAGPKKLPSVPFCCDPLTAGTACPPGSAPNVDKFLFKNMSINVTDCKAYADVPLPTITPVEPPPGVVAPSPPTAESEILCPFSLLPRVATPPELPMLRCPMANSSNCCGECGDVLLDQRMMDRVLPALIELSSSPSKVALPTTKPVCEVLAGYEECQLDLEALMCALSCNPDSWKYINITFGIFICPGFAARLFTNCNFSVDGTYMSSYFKTPSAFLSAMSSTVIDLLGISKVGLIDALQIVVSETENCYAGPTVRPSVPFCCATFPYTDNCPTGSLNGMHPATIAGNMTACNAFLQPPTLLPAPSSPSLTPSVTVDPGSSQHSKRGRRGLHMHWSMLVLFLIAVKLLN